MNNQNDFFSQIKLVEEEPASNDNFFRYIKELPPTPNATDAPNSIADAAKERQVVPQRGLLEETGRQIGRGARGLASGAAGLPGNLQAVARGAGDYVYNQIAKITGLPSSETINQLKREHNLLNLDLPTTEQIKGFIDKRTNNYLAPQSGLERIADTTLEVVGSGGLTNPRNLTRAPGLIGEVLTGLGIGGAQEADLGPVATLGIGAAAGALGRGVGKAISNPRELAAELMNIGPKNIRNDVIQAAERRGVDLPISAASSARIPNFLENRLSASAFSGESYNKLTDKISSQYLNSYKDIIGKNVRQTFQNNLEAGTETQALLKNRSDAAQLYAGSLYENALKKIPERASFSPTNTISKVDDTLNRLKQTAKPSSTEQNVINYLSDLQENLSAESGNLSVKKLLGTKRSLMDTIDFDEVGGSKALLKNVLGSVRQDIAQYGKQNPEFFKEYIKAEKNFSQMAGVYRNDLVRSLITGENPEIVLSKMGNVDGIRKIEQALSTNATGRQLFNDLKGHKLEQLIGEKIFEDKKLSYAKASKFLKNKESNAVIKELVGPQRFKDLEDLQKVAQGLKMGAEKFANPSGTANTKLDLTLFGGLAIKAAEAVSTLNPVLMAEVTGTALAPYALSKLMTNPKFVKTAISAARAGRTSNRAVFTEQMSRLGPLLYSELKEVEKADEDSRAK